MTANSSDPPNSKDLDAAKADEWDASDPVWKLLDEASKPNVDPFFARNVMRAARQEEPTLSFSQRVLSFLSPQKLALGAVACVFGLLVWQTIPSTDQSTSAPSHIAQHTPAEDATSPEIDNSVATADLSELIIIETLSAAAEDPTMFTRDEVVTMLDL